MKLITIPTVLRRLLILTIKYYALKTGLLLHRLKIYLIIRNIYLIRQNLKISTIVILYRLKAGKS